MRIRLVASRSRLAAVVLFAERLVITVMEHLVELSASLQHSRMLPMHTTKTPPNALIAPYSAAYDTVSPPVQTRHHLPLP